MNVCVDVEWGADARGHAKDLWPFITRLDLIHRTADTSACQTLLDTSVAAQVLLYTTFASKTFKGVTRHAMSTDTARIFSMPWDRLDVGGTGRDTHGQTGHLPDIKCVGTLDMSRLTPDKAPFLIVIPQHYSQLSYSIPGQPSAGILGIIQPLPHITQPPAGL